MLGFERKAAIAELLEREGKAGVAALASRFGVSRETVRRDLAGLEREGLLRRTHGGALFGGPGPAARPEFPVAVREVQRVPEKDAICREAARLLGDGETVFMDNSSTTLRLIRHVPRGIRLSILTNSLKLILEGLRVGNRDLEFTCLGGRLKESNMSFWGPIPRRVAGDYYPDKALMSCASVDEERKLADSSADEVETKRLMVERSHAVVILADHSKFERPGQVFLADFPDIDWLVTDWNTGEPTLAWLRARGIRVIAAGRGDAG